MGPQSQSLSMHVGGHQKTQLAPGGQKSLSIGSNAFNNVSQGPNGMQTQSAWQGIGFKEQSRQPATNSKGLPSRMSTTGGKGMQQNPTKSSIHNSNILKQ